MSSFCFTPLITAEESFDRGAGQIMLVRETLPFAKRLTTNPPPPEYCITLSVFLKDSTRVQPSEYFFLRQVAHESGYELSLIGYGQALSS